jgi:hypothetical protein
MSSANEKLVDAAKSGDVAEIERQIAAGADPNAFEGTDRSTPLQRAALYGHGAAIAALVKAGAHVDGANSYGTTPLMFAAASGRTAAVDALVAAGADVHRVDNDGDTALHWASMNGCLDAARALLEAGAKTDVRNKDGKRPIDMVRAPACSLVAAVRLRRAAAPPRRHAQVCKHGGKSNEAAMRALLEAPPAVKPRAPTTPVAAPAAAGGAGARSPAVAAPAAAGGAAFAPAPTPAVDAAAVVRERDSLVATLAAAQAEVAGLRGEVTTRDATIAARDRDAKAAAAVLAAERDAARKAVADRDATIASHVATMASHAATIAARDATIAGRDATIAANAETIAGLRRELDAARSGAVGGAGGAAAPAKPSLVDCELHADAVTFELTRRSQRVRLGGGSFGDVYAATFGDQPCVVKVPRLDGRSRTVPPELQAAFWAEVRTQFAFRHPHIVALHGGYADVDPAAGGVVEVGAVMERCGGGTLEGRLHGAGAAAAPLRQRLAWATQVLSALAYLHAKDFIHADLKPENVLLEDESPGARAKVTDFGLAKQRADAGSTHASHLGVRGSYPYMDPQLLAWETAGGAAAAPAGGVVAGSLRKTSDVYSAGVMLWELATGRRPYADALGGGDMRAITLPQLLAHVMGGGRPATREQLAGLAPAGLGALIGRMWAARAEDRPSIVAAGEELARLAAGLAGDA